MFHWFLFFIKWHIYKRQQKGSLSFCYSGGVYPWFGEWGVSAVEPLNVLFCPSALPQYPKFGFLSLNGRRRLTCVKTVPYFREYGIHYCHVRGLKIQLFYNFVLYCDFFGLLSEWHSFFCTNSFWRSWNLQTFFNYSYLWRILRRFPTDTQSKPDLVKTFHYPPTPEGNPKTI